MMHEGERSQDFEFQWDNWRVKDVIGRGSFSTVYTVVKEEFGTTYEAALKHISIPKSEAEYREAFNVSFSSEEQAWNYYRDGAQRLKKEIDLMFMLQGHSHIVNYQAHKVTEKKNMPGYDVYIRMEKLRTLPQIIREKGDLSQEEVLKVGLDICDALKAVHAEYVLHRDIKLENVFFGKGEYKLGDFGVSRTLGHMDKVTTAGTPHYMAPEIFRRAAVDYSADIYSLGIMLYRLLNGNRVPFLPADRSIAPTWDQEQEAFSRRMNGETLPMIPGVREDLMQVVLKACAYRPEDRYQSALEMAAELEGCRGPKPVQYPNQGNSVDWGGDWSFNHSSSDQNLNGHIDPNATVIVPVNDGPAQGMESGGQGASTADTEQPPEKPQVPPAVEKEKPAKPDKKTKHTKRPANRKKLPIGAVFAVIAQLVKECGAAIAKGAKAVVTACAGIFAAIVGLFKRKPKTKPPIQATTATKRPQPQRQPASNDIWNGENDPWGLGGSTAAVTPDLGGSRKAVSPGDWNTGAISNGNHWDPFTPQSSRRRRFSLSPELLKIGGIAAVALAVVVLLIVMLGSGGRADSLELKYSITAEGNVFLTWEALPKADCYEVYGGEADGNMSVDWQLLAERDDKQNYHISNKFLQAEQAGYQVKAILRNGEEIISNTVYVTQQERTAK